MPTGVRHDFIFVALLFTFAARIRSAVYDRFAEIVIGGGPYWVCANSIAAEWRNMLAQTPDSIRVKRSFSTGVDEEKMKLCKDLEEILKEVERTLTSDLETDLCGGLDRVLYRTSPRYRAKTFEEMEKGRAVRDWCDLTANKLEDIKNRALEMLPPTVKV
jgi:hypothetical protein